MNDILIIIDGSLAKHFLERLCFEKNLGYFFTIVSNEKLEFIGKNMSIHCFDSTSKARLEAIFKPFKQAFIYVQNEFGAKNTYEALRELEPNLDIVMMDFWGLGVNDRHLSLIDAKGALSKRIIDFMPDVAKTAQYIGLGVGEVMEAKIPEGSVFAYRHIGSITQRRWRIALVYRNEKIHFVKPSFVLQPNDSILMVGDPVVLQSIFHTIQGNEGQFPMPFGNNIFVLIDMKNMSEMTQNRLLKTCESLIKLTNAKKYFLHIINPCLNETYFKLKNLAQSNVGENIKFDYTNTSYEHFKEAMKDKDIGLFVTDTRHFEVYKENLFELKIPVLKIGDSNFDELKEAVILSADESELENSANVIVDLSKQLKFEVSFYYYNPNARLINEAAEYLNSLSKLYDKNIKLINKSDINPLLTLDERSDLLHFVSFEKELLKSRFSASFSTNLNTHYYKMSKNYQVFMPIS